MAKTRKRGPGKVDLNLTSMLDIVFQLIVFFLLVTNFASAELPKLKPPEIPDSQAIDVLNRKKITVNVIPYRNAGGEADGSGRAELLSHDGHYQLRLETSDLADDDGYLELWLIDPTVTRMVSLGPLRADGLYDLPPGVDPAEFPVVDVSAEPVDGNPAHSGQSLLRGTLPL